MKCPDFETLSAGVDGATPEAHETALREHIAGCERCQRVRAQLLVLKAAVRGSVPDHAAGPELRGRVEELASHPKARGWPWVAAIAGFAVVVGGYFAFRPRNGSEPFVNQLVGDHILNALEHEKPIQIESADPKVVEQWFSGRVEFAVKLPRPAEARLAGGRLCSLGRRRAALTFYDLGPHRLSVFAMAPDPTSRTGCVEGVQGFTVCRRQLAGVEYAVVSDLPSRQTESILDSVP